MNNIKKYITFQNAFRLFFAGIIGYGMNFIPQCRINSSDAGNIVKFRPPGFVFGIVWSILYLLYGISWIIAFSKKKKIYIDVLYTLQAIFLIGWIVVYSCLSDKTNGIYVLLLNLLTVIMLMLMVNKISKMLLVPLAVWLLFALLLNIFEVQLLK
jgi:tryptophan-rich sensory protein